MAERPRPPLEVMGKRPLPVAGPAQSPRREPREVDTAMAPGGRWHERWRGPVTVRLRRVTWGLVILGVVGAMGLMYLVGHAAGQARQKRIDQAMQRELAMLLPSPSPTMTGVGVGGGGESRQAGWNYFVLARYPLDHARALQAFLAEKGVDSQLEIRDNEELVKVVAMPGFPPGQVSSEEARGFERTLRQLGRAWKQHNRNRGDDLSTLYLEKYAP